MTTQLRPALSALASDPDSTTVRRLWKALNQEERMAGITASLADDENGWVKSSTRAAVAGALRFRPQSVATFPRQKLVSEAARLPIDDVQLLSAYLVDLHLGHRREMMQAFLDTLSIPNEEGKIDSEKVEVPPQEAQALTAAADKLTARFPMDDVVIYFLTLLLQDVGIWGGLKTWLSAQSA